MVRACAGLAHALANQTRLRVLAQLGDGEACVGELARRLAVS
ncbi:MAG: helix-turn-helix domain-containing protein [Tepidisphaeraceae bacterium]